MINRLHPWLEYGLLALLIMGPLLLPGYIFALDMAWSPNVPDILQKLLLLGTFVMAGTGMHKLVEERMGQWAGYLAGLLFVVNPFTYTRLMAGQYLVLLGYALLPWFVRALVRMLEEPRPRRGFALAGWAVVIGAVSIHFVGFMALLFVAILTAWSWGRWREVWRRAGKCLIAVAAGWLLVSAYWIVPLLLGRSGAAKAIAGFDPSQFEAYATSGGAAGVPLNVAALQGFWAEPYGRYALASATGALFWIGFAALMALVGIGVYRAWRRRDRLGLALAVAALVAWVLAMGVAWAPVRGLAQALVQSVPFYRGYREPQKWAAVLVLAYAYLAAGGLAVLRARLRGWPREAATVAAGLVPLALAPMLLWGAGGQLHSAAYPASWRELNARLNSLPAGGVVMFPWHQYISLDFAGRTVANPAPQFFDRALITSNDPELIGVEPPRTPAVNRAVADNVLARRFFAHDAGAALARQGVRYVVLLKQADWRGYGWLGEQYGLKLVEESDGWKLYQVEARS